MDLHCPTCGASFGVNDALVPAEGGHFPCPSCGSDVAARRMSIEIDLEDPAPASLSSTPGPAPLSSSPPALELGLDLGDPSDPGSPASESPLAAEPELSLELAGGEDSPGAGGRNSELGGAAAVGPPGAAAAGAGHRAGADGPVLGSELEIGLARGVSGEVGRADGVGADGPGAGAGKIGASPAAGEAQHGIDAGAGHIPHGVATRRHTDGASGAAEPAGAMSRAPRPPVRTTALASSGETSSFKVYAALVGTALAATLFVLGVTALLRRPPPPPRMPNPLSEQVAVWESAGLKASVPTVAEGVRVARAGLAGGADHDLRGALVAARSALLLDADSPAAIAVYAEVLARTPDRVEPDVVDAALGAVTSAVGRDPDGPLRGELEQARAWLLLRSRRFERARQAAARALEVRPDSPAGKLANAVALIHSAPGAAAAELSALAQGAGASPEAVLWLGEALLRSGDARRAMRVWNEALKGGPADVAVLRRLARLEVACGDHAEARGRLLRIVDAGWASMEDRLLLARLLARRSGQAQGALEQLDLALATPGVSPTNRARLIAEKVAVVMSRHPGAASNEEISRWLDQALDLAPDLPELLYVAGLADEAAGETERAIESLEAAVELAPERPEPALRLALLLRTQDAAAARQVVAAAAREAPAYVPLYLLQALLELDAGHRVAAVSAVRRATDYDPRQVAGGAGLDAYVDPGTAHALIGRSLYEHARGSDNAMLVGAAGMAYWWAGEAGKAKMLLARAVRGDPDEVGARLYRAIAEIERGKLAPARRELAAALAADSQHRVVRFYNAQLLEQSGQAAKAESIYRDLLDKNPLDASSRVGLARTLVATRRVDEARVEALKVLSARPEHGEALRFFLHEERREAKKTRPRRRR